MDTKIDSTHAYMLARMLRSSSLAHKVFKLILMLACVASEDRALRSTLRICSITSPLL